MGGGLKKRTGLEKKGGGVEKKWIPNYNQTCIEAHLGGIQSNTILSKQGHHQDWDTLASRKKKMIHILPLLPSPKAASFEVLVVNKLL